MHVQQIREMSMQIAFEELFRASWLKLARQIIQMFDPISLDGKLYLELWICNMFSLLLLINLVL